MYYFTFAPQSVICGCLQKATYYNINEGERMDENNNINIAVAVAGIDEDYQQNIISGINKS